jgi:hypothetical protein
MPETVIIPHPPAGKSATYHIRKDPISLNRECYKLKSVAAAAVPLCPTNPSPTSLGELWTHIFAWKPLPRTSFCSGTQSTESAVSEQSENNDNDATTDDYPRPAPPGEGQVHQNEGHNQYQDEEQAKKTKKHPSNEKMKEYAHWKAETTRPTRDAQGTVTKAYGAGGRIAQPAGKGT